MLLLSETCCFLPEVMLSCCINIGCLLVLMLHNTFQCHAVARFWFDEDETWTGSLLYWNHAAGYKTLLCPEKFTCLMFVVDAWLLPGLIITWWWNWRMKYCCYWWIPLLLLNYLLCPKSFCHACVVFDEHDDEYHDVNNTAMHCPAVVEWC